MLVPGPETSARAHSLLRELRLADGELEQRLRDGLAHVEQRLLYRAREEMPPQVAQTVNHLVTAGGKRLRPLLVLLGAEFGEPGAAGVADAAVVAELVHVASLYHDDVMDRAALRHGVPSANARWGATTAVRAGNLQLARAAELSAGLDPLAHRMHAEAAERLVEGQFRELYGPVPGEDPVAHYYHVVAGKTGALISLSLCLGAAQAGAGEGRLKALREYGEHLGIAYQIADDLHDVTTRPAKSGKAQGQDVATGVTGLPVLLALRDGAPRRSRRLAALLQQRPAVGTREHRRAVRAVRRSPGIPAARRELRERLEAARAACDLLPDIPAVAALTALCDLFDDRRPAA